MAKCDQIHREYDRYANKDVQSGELPGWMHVRGTVCWYVFQGPYSGLAYELREKSPAAAS